MKHDKIFIKSINEVYTLWKMQEFAFRKDAETTTIQFTFAGTVTEEQDM
jgi:hypothetical protein